MSINAVKCEAQMLRHPWWHMAFTYRLGVLRAVRVDRQTGDSAAVQRMLRFCRLCREQFHDGGPMDDALDILMPKEGESRLRAVPPPAPVLPMVPPPPDAS